MDTTFKFLRKKHHLAIELRYLGHTYQEIADAIQDETGEACSASGIRNWFSDGGKLQQPYLQYCEKENTGRERETRIRLRSLTQDAVERLKKTLLDEKDKEGIRAAIYVLDKILGKANETINLNVNDYEHLTDEQLAAELTKLQRAADSNQPANAAEPEADAASGTETAGSPEVSELGQAELGDQQGSAA